LSCFKDSWRIQSEKAFGAHAQRERLPPDKFARFADFSNRLANQL
jgi:hypothetical protein